MKRLLNSLATEIRKQLRLGHSLSELDPYLAAKELVFKAPPFTPELVQAIKLISPQFHLKAGEASRRFWELNQNGLCWGEYEALEPFLARIPEPISKVLDIGPGLGRSAIFFMQKAAPQAIFHLYEGAGSTTKYTRAGPRFDDSFCGSLDVLEHLLRFHEIEGFEIFDAQEMDASLAGLPGPYDFIYSFFAIGFHWSIEHFLDEILDLMHDHSVGAFTLHDRFEDFSALDGTPHRVVEFRRSWPPERWTRMLVLSKTQEMVRGV